MSQIISPQKYKDKKSRVKTFKSFKVFYLIAVFTSTCVAISISIFTPNFKNRPKFQFPKQVSLTNWQFQSSNNLDNALKNNAIATRKYFYISPTKDTLQIDAVYIDRIVSIPKSLEILGLKYSSNSLNIRYLKSVGYYALFVDQERAYLSSCINPYGDTTVTEDQFINNRDSTTSNRIGSYLLGVTNLRDNRCLFTTISISLKSILLENPKSVNQRTNSLTKTHQKLESAWTNWHQNWQDDFPKS